MKLDPYTRDATVKDFQGQVLRYISSSMIYNLLYAILVTVLFYKLLAF